MELSNDIVVRKFLNNRYFITNSTESYYANCVAYSDGVNIPQAGER